MHDIRTIRDNPAAFDAALSRRNAAPMSSHILALDDARRARIHAAETAQAEQNKASKLVGSAKAAGDEAEFERLRSLVAETKASIAAMQAEAKDLDAQLAELLMGIPNLPFDDTPDGRDESDNVEIHRHGDIPTFSFAPREHYEIPGVLPGMDFEMGAKLSGARFVVLSGAIARLHRALAQFMLDTHVDENGLIETWTPVLVREEMMIGTGQLPKFGEDSYKTTDGWWLVPTAEVTLTNTVNGATVDESSLPTRMVAHTQCFRSEAGSAGRDTAGMLRQHQFEKVEMVSLTHPDHSRAELDRMTRCAEGILERLGLAYRTVALCTGDMGFGARRTHDIEVWLPGQDTYREISSVSVCGDFQARRMNARFRPEGGGKPEFLHTLNGSGLAVGRCLIAVLENGQQEDGSVTLPAVLHPYLGGKTTLTAQGTLA
ncbi:serine--tRNA ligase [Pseudooceanicola sediminis]|uniref:Serine--tRNA ligase n=1 Tax=Pseudooceanicola sediminis TaxID=2211117 RepID=A0A399IZR2_9RHOB|nr:serine--tRNA ligase [Pseudooceanicola sediminis]KAA2312704.1 serine--tRNA ligase [Puniceibacterium sp. HSS470]RII37082.1 serine--tRNA ligase [Pseudooceanicola sediminis]|tara:strand:- start:5212 stop:6504 length:1293 start_codon:yes stop_codon:yes gene_type:complete